MYSRIIRLINKKLEHLDFETFMDVCAHSDNDYSFNKNNRFDSVYENDRYLPAIKIETDKHIISIYLFDGKIADDYPYYVMEKKKYKEIFIEYIDHDIRIMSDSIFRSDSSGIYEIKDVELDDFLITCKRYTPVFVD